MCAVDAGERKEVKGRQMESLCWKDLAGKLAKNPSGWRAGSGLNYTTGLIRREL